VPTDSTEGNVMAPCLSLHLKLGILYSLHLQSVSSYNVQPRTLTVVTVESKWLV